MLFIYLPYALGPSSVIVSPISMYSGAGDSMVQSSLCRRRVRRHNLSRDNLVQPIEGPHGDPE